MTDAARLWTDHAERLLGYATMLVRGDVDLAEDLRSETIFRALRQVDGFRGEAASFTWLVAILRNLNLDRLRRTRRRGPTVDLPIDLAARRDLEPPALAEVADARVRVRAAVLALPPKRRALVELVYLDGVSFTDASRMLAMPRGSASSASSAARATLRAALKNTA